MIISKLFFPGEFETAFLYMGRLLTFSCDKRINVYKLPHITNNLKSRYTQRVPFYEWLFERSDWLKNKQSRSLFQNPEFAKTALSILQDCGRDVIELNLKNFSVESFMSLANNDFDSILDCTIYNGQIYLGTEKGLFHTSAIWDKSFRFGSCIKREDPKVIHVSAKFGTVNISCGSDGLHSSIETFTDYGASGVFKQIEDKSYASNWCSFDLINYPDFSHPKLMKTDTGKQTLSLERETTVLTGIKPETSKQIWDLPQKEQKSRSSASTFQPSNISYMFNSGQSFYITSRQGDVYRLRVSYDNDKIAQISPPTKLRSSSEKKMTEKILSSHPLPIVQGMVVETFDSVELLSPSGIYRLLTEPVVSIRTFAQSHQYQNNLIITTDNGFWLMSVFDEGFIKKSISEKPLLKALAGTS